MVARMLQTVSGRSSWRMSSLLRLSRWRQFSSGVSHRVRESFFPASHIRSNPKSVRVTKGWACGISARTHAQAGQFWSRKLPGEGGLELKITIIRRFQFEAEEGGSVSVRQADT